MLTREALKKARRRCGKSIPEIAAAAEVNPRTASRWFAGSSKPRGANARRLAAALGVADPAKPAPAVRS